jgi:NAD(P)-dependent dehydrogenase (short-subunit alcohol dehydrogenase family)
MANPGIAWVIGGGSGIGAAVATLMASKGWTVVISGRREERLNAVKAEQSGIDTLALDVTDMAATEAAVAEIVRRHGRIDLVLFGAAAWEPMPIGDYGLEKFSTIVDTNFMGFVRVANAAIPQLRRQGNGQLAAIASVAGYFGLPRAAAYSATKAAMINLLETMRTELARDGIVVRMVAPGFVKSEATARNDFDMPFLMETEESARRIVDGLTGSERFEIAFPRRMVWLMKTIRALPYPIFFAAMARLLPKR